MSLLRRVETTAKRRRSVEDAYRAAIVEASAEHSLADIARAAGVRYQSIQDTLKGARKRQENL